MKLTLATLIFLIVTTNGFGMRFTNTDADTFWQSHLRENMTPPLPYERREIDIPYLPDVLKHLWGSLTLYEGMGYLSSPFRFLAV